MKDWGCADGTLDMVHCVRRNALCLARALATGVALACMGMVAWADVTEEGGNTVYRSDGAGGPLLSRSWSFTVPATNRQPRLTLEFGFATDETLVPTLIPDAFTVTVQASDASVAAVLLTADRSGVAWAPSSPGALTLDPASIQRASIGFPSLQPGLDVQAAYLVEVRVPEELAGRAVTVFGDFFDNLNGISSLAYSTAPAVVALPDGGVALESSAAVGGPFAVESDAVLDVASQTFSLPAWPTQRFYRLDSDLRLVMAPPVVTMAGVRLVYAVQPADLVVEEAAAVTGPFNPVSIQGFDVLGQAVVLERPAAVMFYRLKSATPLRVGRPRAEGNRLLLPYLATPARLRVLSSAQAAGPYATESGAVWDPVAREAVLARSGMVRFFRVRASEPSRITRIIVRGDRLELTYDRP